MKNLIYLFLFTIIFTGCKNDDDPVEPIVNTTIITHTYDYVGTYQVTNKDSDIDNTGTITIVLTESQNNGNGKLTNYYKVTGKLTVKGTHTDIHTAVSDGHIDGNNYYIDQLKIIDISGYYHRTIYNVSGNTIRYKYRLNNVTDPSQDKYLELIKI